LQNNFDAPNNPDNPKHYTEMPLPMIAKLTAGFTTADTSAPSFPTLHSLISSSSKVSCDAELLAVGLSMHIEIHGQVKA
jgi:hypothetical protein